MLHAGYNSKAGMRHNELPMETNSKLPDEPAVEPTTLDDFLRNFADWDRPGFDLFQEICGAGE